jgi:hypothetical protein
MTQKQNTQHALLIPWRCFAQEIGLFSGIEAVKLNQKTCWLFPPYRLQHQTQIESVS